MVCRNQSAAFFKYDELDHDISFECSPRTELKNNDKVTVTIKTTDKAAKKIKSGTKSYVISGLKEAEKIDFFEQVELTLDGVSSDGRVTLERNRDIDYIDNFSFSIEPMYNLKNGDVVTVSVLNAGELAEEYNVVPISSSKEYEVSGLGRYANSSDDIPNEIIEELSKKYVKERLDELNGEYSYYSYSDVGYYGAYLFVGKEDGRYASKNELQIFVTYDQYFNGEFDETVYTAIVFYDVVVNSDNSLNVDYENGSSGIFTTDIEYYLENMSWEYEIIKLS